MRRSDGCCGECARFLHAVAVAEIRRVLDAARAEIRGGATAGRRRTLHGTARRPRARGLADRPSLRRVINATGVVLHTNLGRAPLAPSICCPATRTSNTTLDTGKRGKRDVHVAALLERLDSALPALR